MVNHQREETFSEAWQEYSRLMAEQDLEITRKDDQYANVILQLDVKMYKRMEMCEQQIGSLKVWMNETYERDSSVLRNFKQQLQEEKDKAIQEGMFSQYLVLDYSVDHVIIASTNEDVNEMFKDLEKHYKMLM